MFRLAVVSACVAIVSAPTIAKAQTGACCWFNCATGQWECEDEQTLAECLDPELHLGIDHVWTPGVNCEQASGPYGEWLHPPCGGGACCLQTDGCAEVKDLNGDGTAQDECDDIGGVTYTEGEPCPPHGPDPCSGACCRSGDPCLVMPEVDCSAAGGNFQGGGTTCNPEPCAGACCYEDPDMFDYVCTETITQTECDAPPYNALSSTWTPNATCADLDPPCGGGACCTDEGCVGALCAYRWDCPSDTSCEEISGDPDNFWGPDQTPPGEPGYPCDPSPCRAACCLVQGGVVYGCDLDKTLSECSPPGSENVWNQFEYTCDACKGACCLGDQTCQHTYEQDCIDQNGVFFPGSQCDDIPDPCEGAYGTCCLVSAPGGPIHDCAANTLKNDCQPPNVFKPFETSCDACMGACCVGGETCDFRFEDACNGAGDQFYPGERCDEVPDPCHGACCLAPPDQGTCVPDVIESECWSLGALAWHRGESCNPSPCAGACCHDDGESCTIEASAYDCKLAGGEYAGAGTVCDGDSCQACCSSGSCHFVDPSTCQDWWKGEPQGPGTSCSGPGPVCPAACCFPSGCCLDLLPDECKELGGLPQCAGRLCGSYNPCSCDILGDVDGSYSITMDDIVPFVECLLAAECSQDHDLQNCKCADINEDGAANGKDIPLFIDLVFNP